MDSAVAIQAILFDKDGTLFDFDKTWNHWTLSIIEHFADGDPDLEQRIADVIDFDLTNCAFRPTSPVIAGTNREAAELVASALNNADVDAVEAHLAVSAESAPLAPVVPLEPLLSEFKEQGLALGVVTNDTEASAKVHLSAAGALDAMDFVAGHDSGFGAKPDPEPLLAFASKIGLPPANVAMVGDSTHDLIAGRRAGMVTVGVLTGLASVEVLQEYADVVLPHIGHLREWLKDS